jgi:hypothetical protein
MLHVVTSRQNGTNEVYGGISICLPIYFYIRRSLICFLLCNGSAEIHGCLTRDK